MRIVWCTDIHLADRPPRGRVDDYAASIFEKLRQVAQIAGKVKAAAVVMGGDIFHVKAPIRNSHDLVRRAVEAFRGFPCPVWTILGNHDVLFAERAMYTRQPVGVLEACGAMKILDHEKGLSALFEEEGVKVRVEGVPYDVDFAPRRLAGIRKGDEDWLLAVLHVLASKEAGNLGTERIFGYGELAQAAPADVFLLGHYHVNQGVTRIGLEHPRWFVNVGSISRGTLSYEDLARAPSICIMDFPKPGEGVTPKFTVVKLRVAEAKLAFRVEEHEEEKAAESEMGEFVAAVGRELEIGVDLDLNAVIERLDVEVGVKETVRKYLEMA